MKHDQLISSTSDFVELLRVAAPLLASSADSDPATPHDSPPTSSPSTTPINSEGTINLVELLFDSQQLEEVAEHLSVLCFDAYKSIKITEFHNLAWSKPTLANIQSPNILKMITIFNNVGGWVAATIVSEPLVAPRAKLVSRFIKLAKLLRKMNNFHVAMAVVSGLNNSAVKRLHWTWAKLPKADKDTLAELESLFDIQGSWKLYRAAIKKASAPAIPSVGVTCQDLTFIYEGNPEVVFGATEVPLINFARKRQIYHSICAVLRFQDTGYSYQVKPQLMKAAVELPRMTDDVLFDTSLLREPRNSTRNEVI
jgi:hypothetical protein